MNAPLVTVCIPTRDRAHWLGEALHSVLHQTLRSFEVVVYDDASRDRTREIVQAADDPRVRYLRHWRPVGVAANRNACLDAARGSYVAWLDSDDRYLPQMLAVQSGVLERNPAVVMAHGGFEVIDETGRRLPSWPPPFSRDTIEPAADAFRELSLRNYVTAPTVMVRRSAYDTVGRYNVSLRSSEDWEMWMRLALRGDVAYTARPLAHYRWHDGSLSRSAERTGARLRRDLRAISSVFARDAANLANRASLEARARAALAARAVLAATDNLARADRARALVMLLFAMHARPALRGDGAGWRALAAAALGNEYRWHVHSRALLRSIAVELEGSRTGAQLSRAASPAAAWHDTLGRIAETVREVVPADARIAVVDKWDPTLLHLSRRRGWHFPDRQAMPGGYPIDCETAVGHLEQLRRRGADYLVFPCSSLWWLDHYPGLLRHLEDSGDRVWQDERCVIYRLSGRSLPCHAA